MGAGKGSTRLVLGGALLFVAYFGTAHLGLFLGAVAGFATLVWPPTGIALVALYLYGFLLWPAVFAGALLVNLVHGAPLLVAFAIACGNTLEAVVGAWLLRRMRFQPRLDCVLDVVVLILAAAIGSTALSAFIGVGSLRVGGIVQAADVGQTLRAWWIGDTLGDLVVAPLLFVFWARPPVRRLPAIVTEGVFLACALVTFALLVFGNLIREGRLREEELRGLAEDKLDYIRRYSRF